jgi:peptide/nickel transport system permease protein
MVPILLGVSFIIFFIMNMIPGNAASLILGDFAPPEAIDRLNEELGLNEPFLFRYTNYVSNALKGDFGYSYRTRQPVYDEIFSRLPTTLKLASGAIVLAVLIGATLGIISAVRQYSILDAVSSVSAMFISAIPAFWLGLLSILLFSLRLGLLPSNGADQASAFLMPIVTLSLPAAAEILRLTRSTMLEVIRQDYIRTAKAKGAPKNAIIFRHALKNAMFPIITVAGMHFGGLLGGSVITESVFAMPGVGTLVINAIRTKDTPQVMASVLLLAAIFCFLMLAIDLLYAFIDPRVRARYRR